jgi:hypothetical protein
MRVGRFPYPHLLAPRGAQQGNGRFDLPNREARILYLAEDRLTAYLERGELQALRPNLRLLGQLKRTRAAHGLDPLTPSIIDDLILQGGVVSAGWFAKYALVELSPREDQRWLDLRRPFVIEQLRIVLADWLVQNDFADFQFRDLLHDINIDDPASIPVTQVISQLAYDSGFAGIVAPSRPHPTGVCWALYEGTALEHDATITPINPSDRDLLEAFRIYSLRLSDEMQSDLNRDDKDIRAHQARSIATGRTVRGVEAELPGN